MEYDWQATEGDYGKILTGVARDSFGQPVDLTTATGLTFLMGIPWTEPVVAGHAVADPDQITNPGLWSYTFAAGDLDAPSDEYEACMQAQFPAARLTFPTEPLRIRVRRLTLPVSP